MGEPWLDSLSEDWNSEPRLSPPASSLASSTNVTRNSRTSSSRIPHLAHSMRREPSGSSFLRPRSSRGIAKSQGIPVLAERSASSLNLPGSLGPEESTKRQSSVTLPRRVSSNFSDSQQSVQRHTVNTGSRDTPEWKRRLHNGEDIASDGFDLFSPSKLEGMFAQPVPPTGEQEIPSSFMANDTKPWSSLNYSKSQPSAGQFQSFRTSRSRAPLMEALPELNEDEDDLEDDLEHSMSAISSELVRNGSMRGLVKRRVSDLEQPKETSNSKPAEALSDSYGSSDPRWRTTSGQQELRNEYISPVTISTKNTISAKAMRDSVELNPELLKQKLMDASSEHQRRPSSRSSDRDVSYNGRGLEEESLLHEEQLPDVTSHSLPEDLSMGTQDFVSNGGFINTRRGAGSNEASFMRKKLSLLNESSQLEERNPRPAGFRSSPPPYNTKTHNAIQAEDDEQEPSETFEDGSVVHHDTSPQRPPSAGSPLKLFGNRDTYTNNKLLRVLSQFEQDRSDQSQPSGEVLGAFQQLPGAESVFRMSQFGQGELDTFNFEKEVKRPSPVDLLNTLDGEKIFQSLADLTIEGEGTIAGVRPFADETPDQDGEEPNVKRLPSSPAKERTPKRRRTLLRDEISVNGIDIEVKVDQVQDVASLAGRKRKDARPGEGGILADPTVLASRSILQPKSGSRKSSGQSQRSASQDSTIKRGQPPNEITEALAAELASFAHEAAQAHQDSRKPSLATKDYMEEANKVMEFIRARGKPKPTLPEIQEPDGYSELEADRILDLEIEEESTVEPFSRPPSRERPIKPREDPRVAKHDPQIASHLRKFRDSDDLDLVASTSVMGTLHMINNQAVAEAAQVPLPTDSRGSSASNVISPGGEESIRKRKNSIPTDDEAVSTVRSSAFSTRNTFATESSGSSGQKGVITAGKVSIPDNIGTMTFDHEKQVWVKQQLVKMQKQRNHSRQSTAGKHEEATLEDDPFGDIPDLSIDEQHEAAMRTIPKQASRPSTANTIQMTRSLSSTSERDGSRSPQEVKNVAVEAEHLSHSSDEEPHNGISANSGEGILQKSVSKISEVSKHEERLHQGFISTVPPSESPLKMQPRVVTIAFSSPVASEIPQPVVDISAPPSDDEDYLPPDDSDEDEQFLKTPGPTAASKSVVPSHDKQHVSGCKKFQQYRPTTYDRRTVSRIEEVDEDAEQDEGMSLVRLQAPQLETPGPTGQLASKKPASAYKGTSILCLTPLSEFTMHQADKASHPEESFVQERAHPKALLQAHGALALSVDTLVKAITDAVSGEPFWEQLRRLELQDSKLQTVHGLQDYCSALETLNISRNQIAQLDGLPLTLRNLDVSGNKINDFTSWGHLPNLQYVDVSSNSLENLEGFSSLVHIRKLKARSNNIRDIEGVLDLDGLLTLDLQDNQLIELDFEGVDMPRLEELNLKNNKLTAVHNLHCLPRLKRLDLSGNSVRDLKVSEPLAELQTLAISKNELTNIDLAMFPALTELDLDGNCIREIENLPGAFLLRKLSIRDQRDGGSIVDFVLTTPNECSEILLSSNTVAQGQLQMPRYPHYNLRKLDIAACGLQSLPVNFGDYFPNCRSLNLNFNAISDLSPLLGSIKLRKLLIAGNRIKRLRRTCLALSRMSVLEAVDIRNNPLTVGFYAPDHTEQIDDNSLILPDRSLAQDNRWLQLVDETTRLKRRMIELLLLEGCPKLQKLDGLRFNREQVEERDAIWDNLTSKGVLIKMIEAPKQEALAQGVPAENVMPDQQSLGSNIDKGINPRIMAQERRILVG